MTLAEVIPSEEAIPVASPGKLPVIEIFGPTVQGEGRMVGAPCYFVRLGGCDYRCSWCDTPFAVLPEQVRVNAIKMSPEDVMEELRKLPGKPPWIIISGGNPALHNLGDLIDLLHRDDYLVAVETQGSVYKQWMTKLDLLTLSPKPPSSGMTTNWDKFGTIVSRVEYVGVPIDIKIVAFDEHDLQYARDAFRRYPSQYYTDMRHFISTGTFVGTSTRDDILDRMRAFIETNLSDPVLGRVTYGCQFHVLLWGHKRGV